MKIAIAQPNLRIGDFDANVDKLLASAHAARDRGADLLLLPARALGGERAGALVLHPEFRGQGEAAAMRFRREAPADLALVFGAPGVLGDVELHWAFGGEGRAFSEETALVEFEGQRIGLLAGAFEIEALDRGIGALRAAGAERALLAASFPFSVGGHRWAMGALASLAKRHGVSLAWCNPVGGNDVFVYEGGSAVVHADGRILASGKRFAEDLVVASFEPAAVEGDDSIPLEPAPPTPQRLFGRDTSEVIEALSLGIRDYVRKSGFEKVLLGLSGGIDSAVATALAARAIGPENVHAVAMPSRYTSAMSTEDLEALAGALGIHLRTLPIEPALEALAESLRGAIGGELVGLAAENLQARVRGIFLMALSNQEGALVLNAGNESELAVGYNTLYGDMVGALGVLGDLPKTWVYEVARQLNLQGAKIPPRILSRPPSAELRPDQTDDESLPPYDSLDRILHRSMVEGWGIEEMRAAHEDEEVARKTLSLLLTSSYKRRQAAPALRVSRDGLHERRYPLGHAFRL